MGWRCQHGGLKPEALGHFFFSGANSMGNIIRFLSEFQVLFPHDCVKSSKLTSVKAFEVLSRLLLCGAGAKMVAIVELI